MTGERLPGVRPSRPFIFAGTLFARLLSSKPLKSTFALTLARATGVAIQGANYVLVARYLGPERFGIYTSTLVVLSLIFPFITVGAPNLVVQRFCEGFGFRTIHRFHQIILWTSPVWFAAALGALAIVLPALPKHFFLLVGVFFVSEVIVSAGQQLIQATYQARGQLIDTIPYVVSQQILRLLTNVALIWAGAFTLESFAIGQLFVSFLVVGIYWMRSRRFIAAPPQKTPLPSIREDVSLGLHYSFALVSRTIYNDVDKVMLPRMAGLSVAGLYALSYRLMELAFIPLISFQTVLFPDFFREGGGGKSSIFKFLKKILPMSVGYGAFAMVCLYSAAPLTRYVMRSQHAELAAMVRWLAPVILIQAIYFPILDALTGLRQQPIRTRILFLALVLNVVLNVTLIPPFGWFGAALSTLCSEFALMVCAVAAIWKVK